MVVPTYDEAENLEAIGAAILAQLPEATLLVVDDGSPDGTGDLAAAMAAHDPRVRLLRRPGKAGLGRAYLAGFAIALDLLHRGYSPENELRAMLKDRPDDRVLAMCLERLAAVRITRTERAGSRAGSAGRSRRSRDRRGSGSALLPAGCWGRV